MEYVQSITPKTGKFAVQSENNGVRSSEPDLVLGELQIDEINTVTDENAKTNYTFRLKTIDTNYDGFVSHFNLVIKETTSGLYSYIVEYRTIDYWYSAQRRGIDLNNYNGHFVYYQSNGTYFGKVDFIDGAIIDVQQKSCDNPPDNDTGGGGDGNNSDTGNTGDTGNSDSGDSGNGGYDITITTQCCYGVHSSSSAPGCQCVDLPDIITVEMNFADSTNDFEDKSFYRNLRNPCPSDEHCASEIDCQYGWDDDCSCLDAQDENDEVAIAIVIDLLCIRENNDLNANSPFNIDLGFVNPCGNEQIDNTQVENNEKFMCIYRALASTEGFKNLFIDTFGQSIEANITFELVELDENIAGLTIVTAGATSVDSQTIQMNINHLNTRHPIDIAKNIIHEAIHAYLNVKVFECSNETTVDSIVNQRFEELLISLDYGCLTTADNDHDIMFEGFIPVMEQILNEAFDDLVSIEDHNPDINYYPPPNGDLYTFNWQEALFYISLDGLGTTDAFDAQINQNETQNNLFDSYIMDIRNPNLFNLNICNE